MRFVPLFSTAPSFFSSKGLAHLISFILINLLSPGLWLAHYLLTPYFPSYNATSNPATVEALQALARQTLAYSPQVLLLELCPRLLLCILVSIGCFHLISRLSYRLCQYIAVNPLQTD